MEVTRTIQPGKPGSIRFYRRWRERLVAVRYRRDRRTGKTFTTVELIVDERGQANAVAAAYRPEQVVAVRIAYNERELRASAKQAGGHWSRERKAWLMRYQVAVGLGLGERIVRGLVCDDGLEGDDQI